MAVLKFFPYRAMLQSKLSVCLVFVLLLALFFVENQVQQLHSSIRALERALEENTSRQVRNSNTITIQQGPSLRHDPADLVVIYNRVPKTGSTSFTGIAYDLCSVNKYNVIHINTTRNIHTMSVADQMRFVQNVTNWAAKKPAFYHGHVSFIDFASFGSIQQPLYINIIRRPLDRLVSYYYFLRFGDDFRPKLTRHRHSNKETFDECVARKGYDCAPEKLWIQVPFFCGHAHECWQPGSRWALEQAKRNLVNNYMLVGVTEEMQEFVMVLEATLPSMFKGATDHFQTGHKSHLRKTSNKKPPSPETIAQFETSDIWQIEEEFYNFVLDNFHAIKKRTLKEVDGKLVPVAKQFMYEKVRPKS